jgi:hypothetical protein
MNYKDDPKETLAELVRIQKYLRKKGLKSVTTPMIVDAAIALAKRLGAGDYTFYLELK